MIACLLGWVAILLVRVRERYNDQHRSIKETPLQPHQSECRISFRASIGSISILSYLSWGYLVKPGHRHTQHTTSPFKRSDRLLIYSLCQYSSIIYPLPLTSCHFTFSHLNDDFSIDFSLSSAPPQERKLRPADCWPFESKHMLQYIRLGQIALR